jgi:hypothetical protein
VPVGITDSTTNFFGDNFLGSDILSRLPYWELNVAQDGLSGTFFAAASVESVPEPSTLLLFGAGLLGLGLIGCARTLKKI